LSSARDLLRRGTALLKRLPGTDPALEAGLLLRRAIDLTEAELWSALDRQVPPAAARRFLRLVRRRRERVPLAYLTGEKEFWSMSFRVFPGVLIPRPETELLVETAVRLASGAPETIVEVGTGSGCVAIALSRELPASRIFAIDPSRRALLASRLNAVRHSAASVTWLEGRFFEPLPARVRAGNVDLVVSNPPYIAEGEWRRLAPEVRVHEPKRALVGGPDGLGFIRRLARGAATVLRPGGRLVFEVGSGQAAEAAALFKDGWEALQVKRDLAGIPRVIIVRRSSPEAPTISPVLVGGQGGENQ